MTTDDHNKTLGILHLVYGGLHLLMILVMAVIFIPLFFLTLPSGSGGDAAGGAFIALIFVFIGIISLLFTVPSFVAGYGILKRKRWARIWSLIAGGISGMNFPLGTALCVYAFWFMFGGGGKELYEGMNANDGAARPGVLHGAPEPSNWETRNREREYVNTNRSGPPDWRGE